MGGKHTASARKNLETAKVIGMVGTCLSVGFLVLGIVLTVTGR